MQALSAIGCKRHKKNASHLTIFILDVVFSNPYILRHKALIFADICMILLCHCIVTPVLQDVAFLLNNGHENPNA